MNGVSVSTGSLRARAALGFVALALLLRVLIPAGFMPAAGQGFAITLCTGMGAVSAWVDADGKLHKGKPSPERKTDHPCAFAGFSAALDMPALAALVPALPLVAALLAPGLRESAVGRGLAAPPPPPTGPPAAR